MSKFKTGFYTIINEHKYIQPIDRTMNKGTLPQYRSSWELKFYRFCDANPLVVKWGTEPFAIPYTSPKDGKIHRYYIDAFVEYRDGTKFLVEIKPFAQTQHPKIPKKQTVKAQIKFEKDLLTYLVNQAKWEAARIFAKQKGLKFIIITEKELGI